MKHSAARQTCNPRPAPAVLRVDDHPAELRNIPTFPGVQEDAGRTHRLVVAGGEENPRLRKRRPLASQHSIQPGTVPNAEFPG